MPCIPGRRSISALQAIFHIPDLPGVGDGETGYDAIPGWWRVLTYLELNGMHNKLKFAVNTLRYVEFLWRNLWINQSIW